MIYFITMNESARSVAGTAKGTEILVKVAKRILGGNFISTPDVGHRWREKKKKRAGFMQYNDRT